jgi:hypothetical protein
VHNFSYGMIEVTGSIDASGVFTSSFSFQDGAKGNAVLKRHSIDQSGSIPVLKLEFDFIADRLGTNKFSLDLKKLGYSGQVLDAVEVSMLNGKNPGPKYIVLTRLPV